MPNCMQPSTAKICDTWQGHARWIGTPPTKLLIALSQPQNNYFAGRTIEVQSPKVSWHLPGIGLAFPSGLTTSGLATSIGTLDSSEPHNKILASGHPYLPTRKFRHFRIEVQKWHHFEALKLDSNKSNLQELYTVQLPTKLCRLKTPRSQMLGRSKSMTSQSHPRWTNDVKGSSASEVIRNDAMISMGRWLKGGELDIQSDHSSQGRLFIAPRRARNATSRSSRKPWWLVSSTLIVFTAKQQRKSVLLGLDINLFRS